MQSNFLFYFTNYSVNRMSSFKPLFWGRKYFWCFNDILCGILVCIMKMNWLTLFTCSWLEMKEWK